MEGFKGGVGKILRKDERNGSFDMFNKKLTLCKRKDDDSCHRSFNTMDFELLRTELIISLSFS